MKNYFLDKLRKMYVNGTSIKKFLAVFIRQYKMLGNIFASLNSLFYTEIVVGCPCNIPDEIFFLSV